MNDVSGAYSFRSHGDNIGRVDDVVESEQVEQVDRSGEMNGMRASTQWSDQQPEPRADGCSARRSGNAQDVIRRHSKSVLRGQHAILFRMSNAPAIYLGA